MWNLQSIEAKNLCAFEHFKYQITQNQATLIFGNNMDNDSQNSNGSGKSALIEAIAISLIGETLRKVNMEEIINDNHDECQLVAVLYNPETNTELEIARIIPRKGTQSIQIVENGEFVKQATIADYNKFILDTLGLSKDDIYANYILTAKKYKSFLSSSDREKKELINRFSNGLLVDESIEALHQDMEPVLQELQDAEKTVAENTGKVNAIESEIEKAINESNDRSATRKERIETWKQAIANQRAEIRKQNGNIDYANEDLENLDELDKKMQKMEKSKKDISSAYQEIKSEFEALDLEPIADYTSKINDLQQQIDKYEAEIKQLLKEQRTAEKEHNKAQESLTKAQEEYTQQVKEVSEKDAEIKAEIKRLLGEVETLQQKEKDLRTKQAQCTDTIADLQKQLAGVIQCPKCKHEFTLANDLDIDEVRKKLKKEQVAEENIKTQIADTRRDYDSQIFNGKVARQEESKIDNLRLAIEQTLRDAENLVKSAKKKYDDAYEEVEFSNGSLQRLKKQLENQRKDMFDDVFDAIDEAINQNKADIKQYKLNISNAEGAISSYEESIAEAEKAAETDIISSLKESKVKYEAALQQSILCKEEIERKYNGFKVQEATFMEFKTYLANIKIDAISEITNSFLETIGSDIRVKLSGYTMLKSGKVRDKISVSLIRDGVDCGSFEKFSKGEQTRVELANILALHKLTNVNCEYGKGLNLLVFDEILDATDEQGLANVFKALNDTQITSLVVSHGMIAESYPNRLIVCKQNGISFID